MDIKELEQGTDLMETVEPKNEPAPEKSDPLGWKGLMAVPLVTYLLLSLFIGLFMVSLMLESTGSFSGAMNVILCLMIGLDIIMFFLCRHLIRCNEVFRLKWRPAPGIRGKAVGAVLIYSLAMIAFEYGLSDFVSSYTDTEEAMELIGEYFQFGNIVLAFILVVIVTPFAEEMMFRGTFFAGLRERYGFWPAAIVSSAVFAVMHLNPWSIFCTFIIGMFYALLFEKTGSLVYSILGHGVNNLIAVLAIALPGIPVILGPVISVAAMVLMVAIYIKTYQTETGDELDIQVYKEDLSYIDEKYERVTKGDSI